MHLKYFGIRVTDLERSVKFYTALLGLNEVKRGDMSKYGGGRGKWVLLKDSESGAELELNWYPSGSRFATPYVPGEGLDHICFVCKDKQSMETKYKELLANGAEATGVGPEQTEGWQAYVKDPDGNWIELGPGQ